jgi:signal peptidase II
VLLCVGAVVLGAVVARVRTAPEAIGGGLVLGGALGNLSERLVSDGHRGQVPDFITLTHWPTFNVADAAVSLGVVVVAATLLLPRQRPQPAVAVTARRADQGSAP